MWKKFVIISISLIATFSVIYTMNKDLNAAGLYHAGGAVTGRLGELKKGDRVLIGIKNPFNNEELAFQLLRKDATGWYSLSTENIGKGPIIDSADASTKYTTKLVGIWTNTTTFRFSDTNIVPTFVSIDTALSASPNSLKIIADRDITYQKAYYDHSVKNGYKYATSFHADEFMKDWSGKKIFPPHVTDMTGQVSSSDPANLVNSLTSADLKYSEKYHCNEGAKSGTASYNWTGMYSVNGVLELNKSNFEVAAHRAAVNIDTTSIVFSASQGTSSDFASIESTNVDTTSLYTSIGEPMKARVLNDSLTAELTDIVDSADTSITMIAKDTTVFLNASAQAGSSVDGTNTVSVIITGNDGNFEYYKPLEAAKGVGKYELDLTGIPKGSYKIGIVNEVYNESSTAPADCSTISDVKEIEIVEPHTITYVASPQSQSTYEYSKNVNEGDKIGTLNRSDGAVPIHYVIVADGSDTTYQNFEIANLDENGKSSATSLDVKVKASGAPNIDAETKSLKAGVYKFCIVSKDANNNPITDVLDQNKVCTSLIVDKTLPTISFSTTTQKDLKIGDSIFSDTVTTSNKDTLNSGDVTYALTGGVSNVLKVTSDTTNALGYSLETAPTFTGSGLPTTFTLQATIKETDNYLSATTTTVRSIYVYKTVSGLVWTASKGSYSSSDVEIGDKVGDLLVSDGVAPYTYTLTNTGDSGYVDADAINNADFTISNGMNVASGTKVDVKTSKSLAIGEYKIQFKVTDAKGDSVYKTAIITVDAKAQSAVDFKTGSGGTILTNQGLKIKYNDTNQALFAEGGSTSVPIEYYLVEQENQTDKIDPSLYLEVNKANGVLKAKKVGVVKVYALRPGDSSFSDMKSGFMDVTIEPAEQTIAFNDTTNPNKVEKGKDIIQDAKGTIKKDGSAGVGGITYASSDTSIATVDANGKVSGVKAGNATITATLNAPTSTSYDENYETVSCQKVVNVYEGMKLTWSANASNLKAESSTTGDSAGTISATLNSGNVFYKISTNTGIAENADGSLFNVTPTGVVQLKNKITASDLHNHASNDYKVRVEATDGNGTVSIDIVIHIDDASNTPHFTDKDGNIITNISEVYGEHNNSFQLYSSTSNGLKAVYGLDPSDTDGTVTVDGLGVVKILKVGNAIAQAVAPSGTGYDGATITIPITITAGEQSIAFKDTTTLNQKFVENSTFSDPAELRETSANTVTTLRTITYASNTPTVCSIDAAGTITMLTKGICEVTATNRDANWKSASATKRINLYDGMGVSFGQSNTPQAGSSTAQVGSPIGSLSVSGGQGTKTYAVSGASDVKNKDASFFSINTSGVISLKKAVNASDIATYYDNTKKVYLMHVQFETSDSLGNKVTTEAVVEIQGAKLNASFDTGGEGKITKEYSKDGTFTLNLSSNAGNGTPSYQLKHDPTQPSDVLKSVSTSGLVSIENANDPKVNAKPVMVEAVIPANNGYDEETIEVEVEITKAPQSEFGFKNTTIKMSTESTMTLLYKGKLSDGAVTITNPSASDIISISGMDITTNKKTGTVNITIIDAGNRNYKMAKGTADVIVSDLPAYEFMISVPSATYGDTGLIAEVIANELEEEHPGAIGVQTWSSSDPTIAEVDEDGNLTIHKAGSVEIKCIQTSDGGIPTVNSSATLVIKPKPITITINDKTKYVGEALPSFDMTIPSGVLVGDDAISLPIFSCVDGTDTSVTANTPAGEYAITGTYSTGSNPNYNITVTPGKLTVKQDNSLPTWFHLEGVTSNTTLDSTKWHNQDVKVVLDSAVESAGTYNEISLDKTLWDANSITVNNEGENKKDVYFRIDASDLTHPLTMSSPQTTIVKIDKTKPVIKGITGTATNKDAISTLLNKLTFGAYFKPGTKVSIQSDDIQPSTIARSSVSVSGVKSVAYEIFEIDRKTGLIGATAIAHGDLTPNASGISEVTMNDAGLYRVCAIPTDNAGNQGTVSCSDLNVKNIDIDIDKDGTLDNLDPGNDGCPDIDIVLKDEEDKFYKLNADRDGDGIPDLNIDSNGDGKADINIDTDNDEKPDVNLLIITKEMWKPTYCVIRQSEDSAKSAEEYCTVKDLKPTINVDLGDDDIPDIDIDINGDMKADYNITKDGKTPIINIGSVHPWTPESDYVKDNFAYDTISEEDINPQLNIDTDGDGRPDINLDPTNSGKPTINIDVNGDGIPDVDIDSDGDGKLDLNVDEDGNGTADRNILVLKEWVPDKDVDEIKDFPYDTMSCLKGKDILINDETGIQIQKPGGIFLPNYAIRVETIKDKIEADTKEKIDQLLDENTEIKDLFDVKLMEGEKQVEPDGSLVIRLPIREELKGETSIKIIVEQKDGSFKEVEAIIDGDYFVYESDYLGKVGILGAVKQIDPVPHPTPDSDPTPDKTPSDKPSTYYPNTSVKGTYVSGMGGAMTGDETEVLPYIMGMLSTIGILFFLKKKLQKEE